MWFGVVERAFCVFFRACCILYLSYAESCNGKLVLARSSVNSYLRYFVKVGTLKEDWFGCGIGLQLLVVKFDFGLTTFGCK